MPTRIIAFLLSFSLFITGFTTTSPLAQKVTLHFENEPIESALIRLAATSDSKFAFNPDILPKKQVSQHFDDTPVSNVLDHLLGNGFEYKLRGDYIIIVPEIREKKTRETLHIEGKVQDAKSGEELTNTTIYEIGNLKATLTNANGNYSLDSDEDVVLLGISKENYKDTVIVVQRSQSAFLNLFLEPIEKTGDVLDELGEFTKIFINEKLRKHNKNLDIKEERTAQASIVPGISTNGPLSGQITNQFSFNLFGGYIQGLRGFEIGGLFNVERQFMNGTQVSGLFNSVGGDVAGVQVSGGANVVKSRVNGFQAGGLANVSKNLQGLQVGGLVNVTRKVRGLQIAGTTNISTKVIGAQISGLYNQAIEVKGAQFSGLLNVVTGEVNGLQCAGLYNQSGDRLSGAQVGVINHTQILNGVQVGIINHANSVESGTMIGLINIARGEVVALDLDYNDVTEYNASFKSGMEHFYTVFSVGLSQNNDLWSSGFGFGTQKTLFKLIYTGLETSAHFLYPIHESINSLPIDSRLNLNIGIKFGNRFSIHGGPVLHYLYHQNPQDGQFMPELSIGTNPIFENGQNKAVSKWWVGYRVGLRL